MPVADLLRVAIGAAGPVLAAIGAVALTLAAANAYMSGAAALAAGLLGGTRHAYRLLATAACVAVAVVLCFAGWAVSGVAVIVIVAALRDPGGAEVSDGTGASPGGRPPRAPDAGCVPSGPTARCAPW